MPSMSLEDGRETGKVGETEISNFKVIENKRKINLDILWENKKLEYILMKRKETLNRL